MENQVLNFQAQEDEESLNDVPSKISTISMILQKFISHLISSHRVELKPPRTYELKNEVNQRKSHNNILYLK